MGWDLIWLANGWFYLRKVTHLSRMKKLNHRVVFYISGKDEILGEFVLLFLDHWHDLIIFDKCRGLFGLEFLYKYFAISISIPLLFYHEFFIHSFFWISRSSGSFACLLGHYRFDILVCSGRCTSWDRSTRLEIHRFNRYRSIDILILLTLIRTEF